MKKEIADKWVAALESGKYKQTQGCLRDSDGFCCLGVLCDLAVKEQIIPHPSRGDLDASYTYAGQKGRLPEEVQQWAGMKSVEGIVEPRVMNLLLLNDDELETFATIAKIIRENVEKL